MHVTGGQRLAVPILMVWATLATITFCIEAPQGFIPQLVQPKGVLHDFPSIEDLVKTVPKQPFHTLADVDAYIGDLLDLADLFFEKAFTAETRRYKRDVIQSYDVKSINVTGAQLHTLKFIDPIEFNATSLEKVNGRHVLRTPEKVYWILGYSRHEWQSIVEISKPDYRIKLLTRFQLSSYSTDKIDRIAAGINLGYLWIALGSSESSLVSIVCVHTRTGQWIMQQEITIHGVLGALHMFKASNKLYLVVGEQANFLPHDDAALYVLTDNYFDRRDDVNFRVNGVQDIKGFVDSENLYYLVFGSESPKGSQVYQFDMLVDAVNLVQILPDKSLQVLHFVDQHDAKNYILMSNDALPKIYRWSNKQLREWQTLVSEGFGSCCSMGFLTLENLENIIFIAHGNTITFYTDDMTGHYFPTFTLRYRCSDIKDVDGMKLGKDYIITYVCQDDHGNGISLQAQRLVFHELELAKPKTLADDLLQCLDEAHNVLDDRKPKIEYLTNITTSGSIMTIEGSQTWTGQVTFSKGLTVTGTTTFNKVNINPSGSIVPTPGSLAELFSNINSLKSSVEELAKDLDKVLYYSGAQTITGPVTASTLTVDNMDIDSLQVEKLNGIPLADLKDVFMMNGLDQTINESFSVTYMMVDSFTTQSHPQAGTINGIFTNDYMQKSVRDQMVVGDHTYSFILSNDITNKEDITFTINGIDTTTIVTKDNAVTFHDFKVFDNLIIQDGINTGLINNVNVSSLAERVIYTDVMEQQTLSGIYTLASAQVDGNINTATINGIDLHELDAAVVKTTGDFTLLGPVLYKESLTVTGSLSALTINGVEWDNLMDLDSSDLVSTNYYFDNVVIVDAIRSNNINGLDFSRDVVLVDTPQTITGEKSFMADVEVTGAAGVVMEDGGKVNGIDPSQLQVNVDSLVNIIINEEVYLNVPLKCSGDVKATAINGLVLDDIENRYWRRSLNQKINVAIYISQANFHAPVTGLTINGNHILDYFRSSGLQYGSGTYIFQGPVIVEGALEMASDKTVDGVDVSELERNALKLHGEEIIEGLINFSGSLIVVGNLILTGHLNGLNVTSDLMMLDQSFPHTGHLTFREDSEITSMTLSGNMIVDTLNGLDVAKAVADLVLLDENATIKGDLQFTGTVNVYSLIVNGTVDEVNINDLAARSLKKSSSTTQLVTGHIVVKESVHFSQGPYLGVVNSKEWTTHLTNVVLQDYSGTINGVKTFLQPIQINRNFDPITINSINVADLAARILTKSTEQIILNHYTFNNSISANDLMADIIDGIAVSDLQLIDDDGSVGGTVTFTKNVTFLGGLNSTTGVLDGCDILEAYHNAIWKSENGSVNLHLPVVVDSLTVMGSVTSYGDMLAGTSNLVDVMHFLQTLVLRSSDQEITGRVEFLRDVDVANLHVDTIDGVNIGKLYSETVLDNRDVIIRCNLDFTKPLTVGLLRVKKALSGIGSSGVLVNGVDVSDVASRVVLATGGSYIIRGHKTFTHGFHSHHLNVTGSLGGIPMGDFVVLHSADIIEGISFTQPLTIKGNLQVSGYVDGVDLALLFNSRVTLDQDQNLLGSWKFEAIRVEGNLEVNKINDILVSELVVKSGKKSQEIIGSKTLAVGLHVKGDINTTLLNGLDILELNRTIVRKDQDAIITGIVTFEKVVRANKNVLISGTVNGFNLSELNYNLSPLRRIIDEEYERINRLRSLLASFTVDNFANARRLELAYLEKKDFISLEDYGNLWFGVDHNLESNNYLIVRSHDSDCICCNPKSSFFQVNADGSISNKGTLDLSSAVFILTHPTVNLQITLNRRCTEGVPTTISVDDTTSKPPANLMTIVLYLDVVTDAEMFVDNGIVYIVTLSALQHEFNQTGTVINTLKIDLSLKTVIVVWSRQTNYKAYELDLTEIEGRLYILVANHMKAGEINTFRAASELYLWRSIGTEFQLKGEYLADHVTSGIFFKSLQPTEETFFALAQLKAADSPVFENNLKYTTEVLIFQYNEEKFEKFDCLPSYGVLDQVPLTIDYTLYFLLLSQETLHVYEYYPLEGFKLYQTLTIKNAYALAIFEVTDGTFVVVSVQYPPGIYLLKVNTKGVNPNKLLL